MTLEEATMECERLRGELRNLGARIDRDGGHAQAGETLNEMCARLDSKVSTMNAERDQLRGQVASLREALVDAANHLPVMSRATIPPSRNPVRQHAESALASSAAAAEAHDARLLVKERGMVACLHNALEGLAKWVRNRINVGLIPREHQFDLANKVLADGAAMAAEYDAKTRQAALEKAIARFEKSPPMPANQSRREWAVETLRALAKGETP